MKLETRNGKNDKYS